VKDELEAVLARQVCSGRVPLAEAQQAIAHSVRNRRATDPLGRCRAKVRVLGLALVWVVLGENPGISTLVCTGRR
jgi:hypothetical protein